MDIESARGRKQLNCSFKQGKNQLKQLKYCVIRDRNTLRVASKQILKAQLKFTIACKRVFDTVDRHSSSSHRTRRVSGCCQYVNPRDRVFTLGTTRYTPRPSILRYPQVPHNLKCMIMLLKFCFPVFSEFHAIWKGLVIRNNKHASMK